MEILRSMTLLQETLLAQVSTLCDNLKTQLQPLVLLSTSTKLVGEIKELSKDILLFFQIHFEIIQSCINSTHMKHFWAQN